MLIKIHFKKIILIYETKMKTIYDRGHGAITGTNKVKDCMVKRDCPGVNRNGTVPVNDPAS
jgi:hypothetical protein